VPEPSISEVRFALHQGGESSIKPEFMLIIVSSRALHAFGDSFFAI